jgi:recombination protein RecR
MRLSDALRELKANTRFCSVCFNITVDDPCPICSDNTRDQSLIAVVEEPLDVLALERTNAYKGVYHVLHGAISPVNGIGPEDLRISDLVKRVDRGGVKEVIIATNPGLEGDATAMYIRRELTGRNVRLTRLARGLPVGSDIEYADSMTLSGALLGRSDLG